eukprot:CAMPEP_0194539586 /NCGR_PEP_ID=MMETSP0253-20130528/79577_1 /TAXON_ID=2966 /ORGANISM="Noctiluca scintillans" /LENGTH=142 /DNA_ID=CAMNT_0039385877 /DNA_START=286 /DNA_END=715 /DNA_ORIENTATION=-
MDAVAAPLCSLVSVKAAKRRKEGSLSRIATLLWRSGALPALRLQVAVTPCSVKDVNGNMDFGTFSAVNGDCLPRNRRGGVQMSSLRVGTNSPTCADAPRLALDFRGRGVDGPTPTKMFPPTTDVSAATNTLVWSSPKSVLSV